MSLKTKLEKTSHSFVTNARDNVRRHLAHAGRLDEKLLSIIDCALDESFHTSSRELSHVIDQELRTHCVMPRLLSDSVKRSQTAAFTLVKNEPLFLPTWCKYYGTQLGFQNVYVIDNGTSDGSIDDVRKSFPDVKIVYAFSDLLSYDTWEAWHSAVVRRYQEELLMAYDAVIYSDVDEYLTTISADRSLKTYCDEFIQSNKRYVRATGWNVIQQESEAPVDNRCLLRDRGSMWRIPAYDKTLLTKEPLHYTKGFHLFYGSDGKRAIDEPIDQDLALFHAWMIDVDVFWRRRCSSLTRDNVVQHFSGEMLEGQLNPHQVGECQNVPKHWLKLFER